MLSLLTTWLPVLIAVVSAAVWVLIMAAAQFDRAQKIPTDPDLSPRQWHHEYLGLLVLIASFIWADTLGVLGAVTAPIVRYLGAAFMADDAWEHGVQLGGNHGYKTPLHRLYDTTLGKFAVVLWLNKLLDRLFSFGRTTPAAAVLLLILCTGCDSGSRSSDYPPPPARHDSVTAAPADTGHYEKADTGKHAKADTAKTKKPHKAKP
jgi:hypothetical protein